VPTLKKKGIFSDSEKGAEIKAELMHMMQDGTFNTSPSYSANAIIHPDGLINFADKHMHYLDVHPNLDPDHYVANLRLMTRIR
jgi:hypothetical protein